MNSLDQARTPVAEVKLHAGLFQLETALPERKLCCLSCASARTIGVKSTMISSHWRTSHWRTIVKATILNGALPGDSYVDAAAMALHNALHTQGWTATTWTLREEKIAYCLGCFQCWTTTPGLCRIDDTGRDVAASVIGSHLVVYLTPITFGGYSSALKKTVDRSICLVSPFFKRIDGEVHHHVRAMHTTRRCSVSACCPHRMLRRNRSSIP